MTSARPRLVSGLCAALAAMTSVALAVTGPAVEGRPSLRGLESGLIVALNLLLVPPALYLMTWLWPVNRILAPAVGACGIASLLLWAAASVFGLWHLEVVWISLSAIWWIGMGRLMVRVRRRLGIFTMLLGVAAVLDAIVSAIPGLPFVVFALLGGWKLPLSFAWTFWLAIELLRPVPPSTPVAPVHGAPPRENA